MSTSETVTLNTRITVSTDVGELPDDHRLENLLANALFYDPLDDEGNDVHVLAVEVTHRESEDLWEDNEVQFARLLCALWTSQPDLNAVALRNQMNLNWTELHQLFKRAFAVRDKAENNV